MAAGTTLTLLDNNTDTLSITSNGAFTFAAAIAASGSYAVSVGTQPAGQTCTVSNGGGMAAANVANVAVSCTTTTYTIGGTVSGLTAGVTLILLDNNTDTVSITGDGAFTFSTPLAAHAPYAVTVDTQPAGQSCALTNATGTAMANVTNVTATCGNAPFTILQLGHGAGVSAIQMTETRALSQDIHGDWLLSGLNPDITVASGVSGCLTPSCSNSQPYNPPAPIPTALAGQTVVIETAYGLAIRAATDGHLEGVIPGPIAWWKLASDGSYVVTGSATALQAWSLTGKSTFTIAGNYAAAVVFASPKQIQVALGAAGPNVIQTIAVPAATSTVGAAFNGTFYSWFLDGGRFLTNTAQTVWVYSAASVQLDIIQLPAVQNLTGEGNYFWTYAGPGTTSSVSIYAVGSSTAPVATYSNVNIAVGSGLAIGIFPSSTPQVEVPEQVVVVDLSGVTPTSQSYQLPMFNDTTFAATAATQWVVGNQSGVVVDGATLATTPSKFLSLGAAQSIAGGGGVAAIATASGLVYVIDPATQAVQNSFALGSSFSNRQVQLSQDGSVFATLGDRYIGGSQPVTLSVFSLPAGSLTNTFTDANLTETFSLSGSGTLIEQGTGVTAITGGPVLFPAPASFTSFLFATAGNDFVTTGLTDTSCSPYTNFYTNYRLANTVQGTAAGWIDQSHVLVNASQLGLSACVYMFTSASIYDATGTLVAVTTLPQLGSIQAVSATAVYSRDHNAIYSLTTGSPIWNGPYLGDYSTAGAVAGPFVVYPAGASVVASAY